MKFQLRAAYQPTGDQPEAIKKLTQIFREGKPFAVLLGVTGSGKTFTVAHLIQNLQKPTLVISHNKTLAAQLYQEFKEYFPQNAVSYFVSYYDYYQPEAYIPQTDTYIAKETDINEEIDKLRLQATSQIFSRQDVIVVASVSCIYNLGSPLQYQRRILSLKKGQKINQEKLAYSLISLYYQRTRLEFRRGNFRFRGESIEIYPPYEDKIIRIDWQQDRIKKISRRNVFGVKEKEEREIFLYPAKHYLADPETLEIAFAQIREDLRIRLNELKKLGKDLEAHRLKERVNYDLEMIKEMGYVNGIENYSRYFDGRLPGEPPNTLLDYFSYQYQDDFLVIIDESHMTIPQLRGMYRGDKARKEVLIDFGFRLPSCLDNRPLKFQEFLKRLPRALFVSATPNHWEIKKSQGRVVEQLIRPTGVVDPKVEVRSSQNQIEDLIREILKRKEKNERVLVTTLTKKMAEELSVFLADYQHAGAEIKVQYLHSDIDTLKRTDILADLRKGGYDVIVGVNLLREGLDLPEVSLVAILDADKQGFLRSKTALIQTMGRAARNTAGLVILYADEQSSAMKQAIAEVERRRRIQEAYNKKHGLIPKTIVKPIRPPMVEKKEEEEICPEGLTPGEAKKLTKKLNRQMRQYARLLEFEKAAKIRDKIEKLKKKFDLKI